MEALSEHILNRLGPRLVLSSFPTFIQTVFLTVSLPRQTSVQTYPTTQALSPAVF